MNKTILYIGDGGVMFCRGKKNKLNAVILVYYFLQRMSQVHIYQASREKNWPEVAQDYQNKVYLFLLWYVGLAVACRWKLMGQNIL